jgi:hypothetical protein
MTARVSEAIRGWLGWCPNAPALRTAPVVLTVPPEVNYPGQPDGGAGGSWRINQGISIAMSSTKTLARNKQLLWFSLLTGLVLAGLFISQYILRLLGNYPYDAIDFPRWLVLTFTTELFTVFCLTTLLAGLVLSLSPQNGSPVSFYEGLSRTKKYLRPLADWSVIVSLLGTAIFVPVADLVFSQFYMVQFSVFSLFPFNFILLPEVYHIGPMGGTYATQYAVTYTLVLSAINILLFTLTLFVVPLLVLEKKSLREAVAGSLSLIKNVWGEVASCILILGIVLFAVSLTSLLFQVAYGIVAPDMLLFWYPGIAWIAAAVLFMLALCGLAFVLSTVAGIAVIDLYRYAKTVQNPSSDNFTQVLKEQKTH